MKRKNDVRAAIVNSGRILVVQGDEKWYLPGAEKIKGEEDEICLRRGIAESLSGTKIRNLDFFREFKSKDWYVRTSIRCRVYFAEIDGKIGNPSGEVCDHSWLNYSELGLYKISKLTRVIVNELKDRGHL